MEVGLAKKALSHILRGNFGTVIKGATKKTRSQIPDTVEFITDEDTPSWMVSNETKHIHRLTDTDYAPVLEDSYISLNFEESDIDIEAVEIPIVSPCESSDISIVCTDSEFVEGGNEKYFTIHESYDYPPVLWSTLEQINIESGLEIQFEADRKDRIFSQAFSKLGHSSKTSASTKMGLPSVVPKVHQPPIILISIDTLRYGHHKEMEQVVSELGEDAIVPSEPRTQGTWTPPSHASMFTGTHPGKHGYVGWGKGEGDKRPIDPHYTTISELLTNHGYKCSGLVSHSRILPEFGFGRGFHRFRHDGMSYSDWVTRAHDAKDSVKQLTDWIDKDRTVRNHSLFYFLHVFDPHYPYIPPIELLDSSDVDFSRAKEYKNKMQAVKGDNWTYLDGYHNDYHIDAELIEDMKKWYSKSIEYTADQTACLLRYIKDAGLFDDSLIIITGDHGEEFGERGFFTHSSLYDKNIRPFMAIKPPAKENWNKKEKIDTIDFLPTIAKLVGAEIPNQCDGTPIQGVNNLDERITERLYPDWYNVSVEIDGLKGIFTYESNYPDRPSQDTVNNGPQLKEYYRLSNVRSGGLQEANPSQYKQNKLKEAAEKFILDTEEYSSEITASRPSQETKKQLEDLGYK